MNITWIGHSCFKIENDGFIIVTDPYVPGSVPGLKDVDETAQLVCCSHEHADHAYRDGIKIVTCGESAPDIQKISSWHDEVKGAKRGPNTIHVFDFEGKRVVHMGDIGCDLNDYEISMLQGADILLIPVGGYYTIGAEQAAEMVKKLKAGIVIPMHYRDDTLHFGYDVIGTVDQFLDAFGENVILEERCSVNTEDYSDGNDTIIIRMIPQNAGA